MPKAGRDFCGMQVTPRQPDGVMGETYGYSLMRDGFVSLGLLMLCFITTALTMRSLRFLRFHTQNLFRMPRENSFGMRETMSEKGNLRFFWLQNILLMALLTLSLTECKELDSELGVYGTYGVYVLLIGGYFLMRDILYALVIPAFFDRKKRQLFNIIRIYLSGIMGIVILPITLAHIYLMVNAKITIILALATFVLLLLLRIYKAESIFFGKKGSFLQFFLYLCTLEAVPLALITGILLYIANFLKINI